MYNFRRFHGSFVSIQNATTIDDIGRALREIRSAHGLKHISYVGIDAHGNEKANALMIATYNPEWIREYTTLGYVNLDPIVQVSRTTSLPVDWDDIARGSEAVRAFFARRDHFELGSVGVTLQLATAGADLGFISFTSDDQSGWIALRDRNLPGVSYLGRLLHSQVLAMRATDDAQVKVPPQAQKCLQHWSAGDSVKTIAFKLGLSQGTVWKHLERAKTALGCRTKAQTLAKAVRLGIISCILFVGDATVAADVGWNDLLPELITSCFG